MVSARHLKTWVGSFFLYAWVWKSSDRNGDEVWEQDSSLAKGELVWEQDSSLCQRREKKVEENETILRMKVNKRNQRV